ncbi:preprotein translocase subunit SecD [Halorubellus sp. JP-L1]|uniref:preprotein translocase subunit SecD n=1 Tax=Halorubellus sp. JP-L1 TaxID=2715753 RepID=UPI00140D43DA|nr:preprotein translocase subunit SecD [Halorubellus sp. JP-L1]NHN41546.1 preprotein translocase subunit SecD [Halorubellus sp. JP-L1]
MADLRGNWRIILLVVMLAASGVALFVPSASLSSGEVTGATNLQYGLELDGGTRIRSPVVGMSATQLDVQQEDSAVVTNVSERLGVPRIDVAVRDCEASGVDCRTDQGHVVEVFNESVDRSAFVDALREENIQRVDGTQVSAQHVRDDPSPETYERMASSIQSKLDATGLTGGTATVASSASGQRYVVVEAPNRQPEALVELLDERGLVTLTVRYPANGTMEERVIADADDIRTVDPPRNPENARSWQVPVKLTQRGGERFQQTLNGVGFTEEGNYRSCPQNASATSTRNDQGYCLLTIVNGDVKGAFSMDPQLARTIRSGQFDDDPRFFFTAGNQSDAQNIQTNLEAGALPAPLDLDQRQTFALEGALADQFKGNALITAIVAVLAVSFTVYIRYRNVTVAAPMVVTALSEVVLLLGFASVVGLPLDLSHIAGFIAVIGTGVDDLIIIADEVMAEEVNSQRVFQSRFRKAFWVIGAAAATTIIAMSPLAVLSLGDLRGFAIITILGVLLGVLVTRPAYGDILRSFVTGDK